MAQDLLSPILNNRTRSVNFFNGRLLTGEDLTAEQQANRVAHGLLGQSIGSGVAYGLEVSESKVSSKVTAPVLAVTRGLAINRNGTALLLDQDTEIALTRSAPGPSAAVKVFNECEPVQSGPYVAGAAVYLLTIGPASATQGLAEVSGVSTGTLPCNSKYKAEGVQFRRIQLDLTLAELSDTNHLRNLVAYKFFGVADWASAVADPFGEPPATFGLMDQLRSQQLVSDCEVPLAVFYWTDSGGLRFVDMWAVRRPLVSRDLLNSWAPGAGRRRFAEGLAMFLQFEAHVNELIQANPSQAVVGTISASQYFKFLPPMGILRLAGATSLGFDYVNFFGPKIYRGPMFIEGAKLGPLAQGSFFYPPVDLTNPEMVWLYWVRENLEPGVQPSPSTQPYLIFTNGHVPFQGVAQFDLNYWSYADFI
jgi:hypothetical protein